MNISPDQTVYFSYGFIQINATLVVTWLMMAALAVGSILATRNFGKSSRRSRAQNFLEMTVLLIAGQIEAIGLKMPRRYLPFIGSLFLFIASSSLLTILPGYQPPTGSLSTTVALALCVLFAVPFFGIWKQGLGGYLKTYLQPTPLMLPFNLIGELSRTLALAVRLFGNMMSGVMIVAVLLSLAPLFIPVLMTVLGLVTGMVQAYIFSVLTAVYIASATQSHPERRSP
ncbi:MAG: F0F1 ATP synthase subunit A [Clostridia bacterium]|nr:F0F1 ATP synthase subunit A [Clostridia bacterium]NCC74810.1 F0F1 ATP synthase subunit A [Clostridia bacterium]